MSKETNREQGDEILRQLQSAQEGDTRKNRNENR